jgi:hypothetical protein
MMAQAAGDLGAVVSRMTWLEAVEMSREVAPEAFWRRRVMAPWTPVPEVSPAKRVSSTAFLSGKPPKSGKDDSRGLDGSRLSSLYENILLNRTRRVQA